MAKQPPHPALRCALLEVLENQFRDGTPTETRITLERLLGEGYSREQAVELIACVVSSEIVDVLKSGQPYKQARYLAGCRHCHGCPGRTGNNGRTLPACDGRVQGPMEQRVLVARLTMFGGGGSIGDGIVRRQAAICCRGGRVLGRQQPTPSGGPVGCRAARATVDECVRRFNALDDGWICTLEREDIYEQVGRVVEACGFGYDEDWITEREW
jgi:hypothetical protein